MLSKVVTIIALLGVSQALDHAYSAQSIIRYPSPTQTHEVPIKKIKVSQPLSTLSVPILTYVQDTSKAPVSSTGTYSQSNPASISNSEYSSYSLPILNSKSNSGFNSYSGPVSSSGSSGSVQNSYSKSIQSNSNLDHRYDLHSGSNSNSVKDSNLYITPGLNNQAYASHAYYIGTIKRVNPKSQSYEVTESNSNAGEQKSYTKSNLGYDSSSGHLSQSQYIGSNSNIVQGLYTHVIIGTKSDSRNDLYALSSGSKSNSGNEYNPKASLGLQSGSGHTLYAQTSERNPVFGNGNYAAGYIFGLNSHKGSSNANFDRGYYSESNLAHGSGSEYEAYLHPTLSNSQSSEKYNSASGVGLSSSSVHDSYTASTGSNAVHGYSKSYHGSSSKSGHESITPSSNAYYTELGSRTTYGIGDESHTLSTSGSFSNSGHNYSESDSGLHSISGQESYSQSTESYFQSEHGYSESGIGSESNSDSGDGQWASSNIESSSGSQHDSYSQPIGRNLQNTGEKYYKEQGGLSHNSGRGYYSESNSGSEYGSNLQSTGSGANQGSTSGSGYELNSHAGSDLSSGHKYYIESYVGSKSTTGDESQSSGSLGHDYYSKSSFGSNSGSKEEIYLQPEFDKESGDGYYSESNAGSNSASGDKLHILSSNSGHKYYSDSNYGSESGSGHESYSQSNAYDSHSGYEYQTSSKAGSNFDSGYSYDKSTGGLNSESEHGLYVETTGSNSDHNIKTSSNSNVGLKHNAIASGSGVQSYSQSEGSISDAGHEYYSRAGLEYNSNLGYGSHLKTSQGSSDVLSTRYASGSTDSDYNLNSSEHAISAQTLKELQEHYGPAKYEYAYSVHDPHTHDIKSQHEISDGHLVKGVYSLYEPDGSVRKVQYTADEKIGFQADVNHETKHIVTKHN